MWMSSGSLAKSSGNGSVGRKPRDACEVSVLECAEQHAARVNHWLPRLHELEMLWKSPSTKRFGTESLTGLETSRFPSWR
jgi:hypothetical protein